MKYIKNSPEYIERKMRLKYRGMVDRCYNPSHINYKNYGGRGITVCERWLGEDGYNNFFKDMNGYPPIGFSLDRIDNNGNYEPSNCKWSNNYEQQSNRRNNSEHIGVYELKAVEGRRKNPSYKAFIYVGNKKYEKVCKTLEEAIEYRKKLETMHT